MQPRPSVSAMAPGLARFAVGLSAALLSGCSGGVPLLHPAHALAPGKTAFAAGLSDRLLLGDERRALDAAQQRAPGAAPSDDRATRGALVALAEGPALAPFAAAHVGLPGSNEVGLSSSGPALRGDARHAFEWAHSALSLGLGVTGRGFGQSALDLSGTDLSHTRGFGLDLPVLFGYRTDAELLSVWAGLRGSLDHWWGSALLDQAAPFELRADRAALGPVLGLAVGLPPFWVAAELEVDYAHVTGSLDRGAAHATAQLSGWSARPAGALIAKF